MVLGGRAFGRLWSHEGGALGNEISALIQETSESTLTLFGMGEHNKKMAIYEPGTGFSPDIEYATTWILDFPTSRWWEVNICCL